VAATRTGTSLALAYGSLDSVAFPPQRERHPTRGVAKKLLGLSAGALSWTGMPDWGVAGAGRGRWPGKEREASTGKGVGTGATLGNVRAGSGLRSTAVAVVSRPRERFLGFRAPGPNTHEALVCWTAERHTDAALRCPTRHFVRLALCSTHLFGSSGGLAVRRRSQLQEASTINRNERKAHVILW